MKKIFNEKLCKIHLVFVGLIVGHDKILFSAYNTVEIVKAVSV